MIGSLKLLGAYLVAIIIAGHGAAPVGLLLLKGSGTAWGIGLLLGWLSVGGVVAATVVCGGNPGRFASLQLAACVNLYVSWIYLAWIAADGRLGLVAAQFIGSAPFQIVFVSTAWKLLREIRRN